MGLFNKLLGYRWSLYITKHGNEIEYVMHENSVIRIAGYVMSYFKNGATPNAPWSLHLNFNKKHQAFELNSNYFSPDGENITNEFIQKIESIDPGYRVSGSEPVFMNAKTKQNIKISKSFDFNSIKNRLDNLNSPEEITFYGIMDEIFKKA